MFSAGQAAFKNNGQGVSANLAEWARDHYLGPVVTFGEWVSYNPPPKGGKPSFSLAVPSGEALSPGKPAKAKAKNAFVPDIPATLKSLAGSPIAGEGQWRVVEKVNGNPAILTTFLRDATYTSQVNGIASIDQRLVKFSLRPGTEDPGTSQNWGVPAYIPASQRKGLLATFNGGFKLDSAGGGFYLNGIYHGSLVKGTASIVYYKNGTIKIGEWGRDFSMNSSIEGVRQNLKLLVDHGKVSADAQLRRDEQLGRDARRRLLRVALRDRHHQGRPDRLRLRLGAQRAGPGPAAAAGRRGRGHADGHQPGLDEVRLLPGQGQPGRPDPGAAAADPVPESLLLLHPVHPRLHRGLRAVTINKTAAPGEDTGPQAAVPAAAAVRVSPARWLRAAIMTTRPRQWPKNLLVFAAPLAGASLGRNDGLGYALLAMFAFGCASAAVYFVNDVADVERDRRHPVKRNRPIASGALPEQHAVVLAVLAALFAVGAGVVIREPLLVATASTYLCLSFLYSFKLKHVPYVEMLIVASGFVLRVLGGAAATHVKPSVWFLLVCSLGALGVTVAKRYTELTSLGADAVKHRPVMRWYRPEMLRIAQVTIGVGMLATYLMWALSEGHAARPWHLASALPLAAALVRFGVLTARRTVRPVEDLITRDAVMLCCEVAWLILFCVGLYVE